ncbi:MAG: pyrroloquinoline quinone biosynthesis protein PqqB [gamma proteobacterium symbiont of Ctena orbiculata]|nr:pyrroloquinoline quinone biosynthesis protein PqqB [Candidatus Thiodiazotropha taylori]PUB86055.1 MAG: pyrroloquinoline quinone biosynthesis protein PqqB [gamma proteobacterium symbiont of Ctena orbiculata]MBT2996521.1 pyrroloquinoline quinone biosynthesis protein PqqB [Candidatus Thiodiazotropha taylori]MBT3000561.1 pyrroloquinoline quinone biosynthesis protein PqqB [Candidatus Thiodiazotropha taylori]MBT3026781.1 pyrroloquinoline quinone biosynthesis protein PqqB [Candidatus Thiodiazotroph
MLIHILGSGAGGGFPQWNCNCTNCLGLRTGAGNATPRTQSSITLSANGDDWVLFNASPDIRQQLASFPVLQPGRRIRDTAIRAIVLVDAQIDHTTGLLMLREHTEPWDVYCTRAVHDDLTSGFPVFNILSHFRGVNWHEIGTDQACFTIPGIEGVAFSAVPLKSEAPPYSPHRHNTVPGDNIGLRMENLASGKNLFYAPGLGELEPHVIPFMEDADCLLVDGTLWTDNEMITAGISNKHGKEMGHLDQSGEGGIIEILSGLPKPRKILIHINNTNPILLEDSPERLALDRAGIEVSYDGMEIEL